MLINIIMRTFEQYLVESNFFILSKEEREIAKDFIESIQKYVIENKLKKCEDFFNFRGKNIKVLFFDTPGGHASSNIGLQEIYLNIYNLEHEFDHALSDFYHELEHNFDIKLNIQKRKEQKSKNPYFPYSKSFIKSKRRLLDKYKGNYNDLVADPEYDFMEKKEMIEFDAVGAEIANKLIILYEEKSPEDRVIFKNEILKAVKNNQIPMDSLQEFRDIIYIWTKKPKLIRILINRIKSLVKKWI